MRMKKKSKLRTLLVRVGGVTAIGFASFLFVYQYIAPSQLSGVVAKESGFIKLYRRFREDPTIENALIFDSACEEYLTTMYLTSLQCSRVQRKSLWQNDFLRDPNSIIQNLKKVDYNVDVLKVLEELARDRSELSQMIRENPYDEQVRARMVKIWGPKMKEYIDARTN